MYALLPIYDIKSPGINNPPNIAWLVVMSGMGSYRNLQITNEQLYLKQGHLEVLFYMHIFYVDAWYHFYCQVEHFNFTSLLTHICIIYA